MPKPRPTTDACKRNLDSRRAWTRKGWARVRPYTSPAVNARGGDSSPLAARMSPMKKTIFCMNSVFCMNSADGEQLFVESADLPRAIYEMNLEYPVPLSARSVRQLHSVGIAGVDIKSDLIVGDLLVRKNANEMACDGATVLPASLLSQLLRARIKLGCGDLRMFMKILLAAGKCFFNIAAQFVLQRIVSHNVGATEVGFPFLKYGAEIQKDDVVLAHRQVWRILIVGSERVPPRAHDAFVPIARDSEHALSECINTLVNLAFLGPGPNHVLRLDLCEQRRGLSLSIQQTSNQCFFQFLHEGTDYNTQSAACEVRLCLPLNLKQRLGIFRRSHACPNPGIPAEQRADEETYRRSSTARGRV